MICRSSTTGMSQHPNVTALAQDALRSTSRAERAVLCLQGADRRGTKRRKYSAFCRHVKTQSLATSITLCSTCGPRRGHDQYRARNRIRDLFPGPETLYCASSLAEWPIVRLRVVPSAPSEHPILRVDSEPIRPTHESLPCGVPPGTVDPARPVSHIDSRAVSQLGAGKGSPIALAGSSGNS